MMTDKERFEWAERIVAVKNDEAALDALAQEGREAGHTSEDIAAYLNIAQDLSTYEEADTVEEDSQEESEASGS